MSISPPTLGTTNYHTLSWRKLSFYKGLVADYLEAKPALDDFYRFSPDEAGLDQALAERRRSFPVDRTVLVDQLKAQYRRMAPNFFEAGQNRAVIDHIEALARPDTFTVTTGHQLQLFGGVHFLWYKLINTVQLAHRLNARHPDAKVVPVYWMGSEDHDFEEIRELRLFDRSWRWESRQFYGQAVGNLDPRELEPLLDALEIQAKPYPHGPELTALMRDAFLGQQSLADAFRLLVHRLLGEAYGLVVLDSHDPALKATQRDFLRQDVLDQSIGEAALEQTQWLEAQGYASQIYPYAVNHFLHTQEGRQRLVAMDGGFQLKESPDQIWSVHQMERMIEDAPERFSPNVVTRPMLQERLLPNLAYIGGPSEIHYWLQLKAGFEASGSFFPALVLRNSAVWLAPNEGRKIKQLGLSVGDFFQPPHQLKARFVEQTETVKAFFEQIASLQEQLAQLHQTTDSMRPEMRKVAGSQTASLRHAVEDAAQKVRRKARHLHHVELERIDAVRQRIFPEGVPQERKNSFIPYFLALGPAYFQAQYEAFDPLIHDWYVFEI